MLKGLKKFNGLKNCLRAVAKGYGRTLALKL